MQINVNNYSIAELVGMLERRDIIVNDAYQRSSGIWPPGPSSYFIDTIISGFPFPKIYMYEFLDRENRTVRKEIVDGQQRIGTIVRFLNNEFSILEEGELKGMKFDDLDDEGKNQFLSYSVAVDVIRNASSSDILEMFRRMNAYTLPLNDAEKRHSSFQGRFKWFVNGLADELNEFFVEFGVLTKRQIMRMADAALLTECLYALENGVVSSSPSELTKFYRKYDDDFPCAERYHQIVREVFDFIAVELSELRGTFMMKPYALHSLFVALTHNKYRVEKISDEWGAESLGVFAVNLPESQRKLYAMARAHEARESDGQHDKYVWGCLSSTNKKARRTARVAALLRALGSSVPSSVDDDLS